jgi:nucleoside-diphosphate-sugar epimerase
MRALITGATGFVGSHLTELLSRQGHAVAALRRPATRPWRIEALLPRVTSIVGDSEHPRTVAADIKRFAPDAIFHAGWYGVAAAFRNDPEQITRNLQGTAELVSAAAEAGCRTFVGLGSQAEYGPQNRILRESDPTEPTSTYGVAKLCALWASRHLARQTGMRFAWLRIFSLYGPRDNRDYMIPSLVEKLLRGEKPSLTAGEQRWDYLYVRDAAEAIVAVAETPGAEGVFNLGSGRAQTIRQTVERLRDLIDPALPLGIGEVPYRPDQVMHLEADISRLRAATGWSPRTTLADGLRETIRWQRAELAKQHSRAPCCGTPLVFSLPQGEMA